MTDKPDFKALGEQIRALAELPHMKRIAEALRSYQSSRPDSSEQLRQSLIEFGQQFREQPRRPVRNTTKPENFKRGRGRPKIDGDDLLVDLMEEARRKTGCTPTDAARALLSSSEGASEASIIHRLRDKHRKKFMARHPAKKRGEK